VAGPIARDLALARVGSVVDRRRPETRAAGLDFRHAGAWRTLTQGIWCDCVGRCVTWLTSIRCRTCKPKTVDRAVAARGCERERKNFLRSPSSKVGALTKKRVQVCPLVLLQRTRVQF
jgi:hypothetical protein